MREKNQDATKNRMKKTQRQEKQIQIILSQISEIQNNSSDKKIEKILNEVQKELSFIA